MPFHLVATGVKHAHPVVEEYDIGANDEPNGHGTIAYKWEKVLAACDDSPAAQKLKTILQLSNFTVGDAITNLLIIESILQDRNMTIQDFYDIYHENPSKTYKAVVEDRTRFKVIPDESRLTAPIEL